MGSYLLRRSPDNHFTYFLHYVIDSTSSGVGDQGITERSLRVVHILQSEESGLFSINKQDIDQSINLQNVEECYTEISALVKDIMAPLGLKTCLHPSEYDRCPILLICRSEKALGNDIIGQQERLASQQKLCIPLSALSRIENVKIVKGHFTKLWKARWTTKDGKSDVAIKQLKHNDSHLQPFMHMCAQAMLWNDSTLEHFRQFTGTAFPGWSGGTSLVVLRGHCCRSTATCRGHS